MLPQGQPYIQRYVEYAREFGDLDDIAVAVEASSLTEAKDYATQLVRELRARHVPLKRIAYRIDPKQFEGRALLYLSSERLGEIRDKIYDNQELMEAFAARPTLDTLVQGISGQVASGFASGFLDLGLSESKGPVDLRFIQDLVNQISERLDRPAAYRSPFGALFSVERPGRSKRWLLPLRGPTPALHPGRAGQQGGQLHGRSGGHRGNPGRHRFPQG